ncbi:MAG: hypothetical protein HY554_06290 [Elusimicrobia bacterium]|nr:hypothetical protein [Elusimicrobiota bacterium]
MSGGAAAAAEPARREGWLLLLAAASAFASGVPASDPVWWAVSVLPWALALAFPPEIPWRPALAAWAAWLGWTGVCGLLAPEPWLALGAWWRLVSCCLALALAGAWWSAPQRRTWGLGMLAVGLLGVGGLAAERLGLPWPGAFAASPGLWAAAGAAAAAGWLAGGGETPVQAWVALVLGAAVAAWLGAWPARLALALSLLVCVALGSRRGPATAALAVTAIGLALDRSGLAAWQPVNAWSVALGVLADQPVVGVGPGLLGRELARLSGPVAAPRSFLLGVGAETGYFGLGLLAAAAAATLPRGFRRLDGPGRAASAAFLVLTAYAALEDVPASPAFLLAAATAAAVALGAGRLGEGRASDAGGGLRLQRWFTAAGLAMAVGAALPRELLRRSLEAAASAPSAEARIAALERAARIGAGDSSVQARLARENLFLRPARVGEALRRLRLAIEADPSNPVYRAQLAELWAAFGDLARAAEAAEAALRLEPRYPGARLVLAEREAAAGRAREARALLEQARSERSLPAVGGAAAGWDLERERRIEAFLVRPGAP